MADLVTITLDSLAKKYEAKARALGYATDAASWITDVLEGFLWSAQRDVLDSVVAHRYTAVKAGHGVGKSYLAGSLVAWWLLNHPTGRTRVVTTAPTAFQVEHVIWLEVKRVHAILKAKGLDDGSYITASNQPQWKTRGGQLTIAVGRKPADHDAHGFQGTHDDYLLVIIDEACGVPKLLFDGVDSLATGADNRIVAFGNPTDPQSHFKTMFDMPDWNKITIDVLRSPNMTQAACDEFPDLAAAMREAGIQPSTEYVPPHVAKSISSAAWVAEKARMWGTKSSLWRSKVRAEFPDDSTEGVIPLAWIEAAQRRWIEWDEAGRPASGAPGHTIISCDVSGGGEDATCIGYRVGPILVDYKSHHGEDDPIRIYKRLIKAIGPTTLDTPGLEYVIDATGNDGAYHRMREHMVDMKVPYPPVVHGFVASRSAPGLTDDGLFGFPNMRSWAWWRMRTLLDPHRRGGSNLLLPPNQELCADLQTPRFKVSDRGTPPLIKVELKEDIRKRLGRSPDAGDMCVMAFSLVAAPVPKHSGEAHQWGERTQRPAHSPERLDPFGSTFDDVYTGFGNQDGF